MEPSPHRLEKTAFWILLGILMALFFQLLSPFSSALVIALVTVLACQPFYTRLLQLFGGRRHLAAIACMILITIFLAGPLVAIISLLGTQLVSVLHHLGGHIDPAIFTSWLTSGPLGQLRELAVQTFGVNIDITPWLVDLTQKALQQLYHFSPLLVSGTTSFLFTGIIAIIFTYFLLIDGATLYHEILRLSPLKNTYEQTLAREIQTTFYACIYGYVLTAVVQAILASIGFWLAGIEIALLLGAATFVMAFIPIIGTAGVWVPVVIYYFATGEIGKAAVLTGFGVLIISGIDNVLKPILIQGKTKIHPVILFVAILGGLKLWGPVGILAGPTLIAVLIATLKIYKADFLSDDVRGGGPTR